MTIAEICAWAVLALTVAMAAVLAVGGFVLLAAKLWMG